MGILTDRILFTGTPENNDVIHMVDVSDPTDNPSGSSFQVPLSGLSGFFSGGTTGGTTFWSAGTGTDAVVLNNSGGDSSGLLAISYGSGTTASGITAHAEGALTLASGDFSHAEGVQTTASGNTSHAEGGNTIAGGTRSHAEGTATIASGDYSHAEGNVTIASGTASHSEGINTTAIGDGSHSEGSNTISYGYGSHSGGYGLNENNKIIASGDSSFVHYGRTCIDRYTDGCQLPDNSIYVTCSGDVLYRCDTECILGFTFYVEPSTVTGASGGDWGDAGGSLSTTSNQVNGFDFGGLALNCDANLCPTVTGGCGTLCTISSTAPITKLTNLVFADCVGGPIDMTFISNETGAYGDYSAILGGRDHLINSGSDDSIILGGTGNTIGDNVFRSAIIGGSNISASTSDMIYTPNITLSGDSFGPGLIRMQNNSGIYVGDVPSNNFSSHGFTDSGSPRVINKNGDESIALCMDYPYDVKLDYKNNGGIDEILRIGVTTSGGTSGITSSFGTGIPIGIIINSNTSKILSGVTQSAIIGGALITATTDNTVYVPNLNIGTVGSGTPVNNLGIDSDGYVVDSGVSIQEAKLVILSGDVLQLNSIPQQIISAPGSGKIIDVIDVVGKIDYGTTDYTGNTTLALKFTGATDIMAQEAATSPVLSMSNSAIKKINVLHSTVTNTQIIENESLYVTVNTGNPANGDSTITIYVTYKITTL